MNVQTANSEKWEITKNEQLSGRVLTAVKGRILSLIENKRTYRGKYGNWIALKLTGKGKTIALINIYRIPTTTLKEGVYSSLVQYNLIDGKAKIATQYRAEVFKEIEEYIQRNQDITDVILVGDLNQNVASTAVQKFFSNIGIADIH